MTVLRLPTITKCVTCSPNTCCNTLGGKRSLTAHRTIDCFNTYPCSFSHILNLRPDVIKLDITITRDIDKDEGRRALASALRTFAGDTGSTVVAEGVETEAELAALRDLGMTAGQGYHLGRPGPLPIRRDPLCSPSRGPERSWGRSPHGQRSLSTLTA